MSNYDPEKGGASCPLFPKRGPRAVVLCDGPPPAAEVLQYWLAGADLFICADAAGHPYDQLPRLPDAVVGDFDSLAGRILDGKSGPKYLQLKDQFTTDSEKAILFAVEQGMQEVVLIGSTGWRLDHTVYNCQLVERFAGELRICVAGEYADMVRLAGGENVAWHLPEGTLFSLLPILGTAKGVTVEGAQFPMLGETVEPGGPAMISNRVTMSPLLVTVGEGSMLVSVHRELDI